MSWNNDFFTLLYQEIFMSRTQEDINFDVQLIKSATKIEEGKIVDFCCGVGDILQGFEKNGYTTYGIDFSHDYVNKANHVYQQHNVVQGDALTYQFEQQFDLAINWFSSFGYFTDDKNQMLLDNIYQHTKFGGKFALEIYNSYDIIKNFKKTINYEKMYLGKCVKVTRNSSFDIEKRILLQQWSFEYDNKLYYYNTQNTIYFIDEIMTKMKKSGFKNINVYERSKQTTILNTATLDSVRLLFIGEK